MINRGDFIELEFTGIVNGEVFDTTDENIAKSIGYKGEVKPIKIIVGEGMVVRGLDKNLEGKEVGKEYEIKLKPNEAFGEKNAALIKTISINAFNDKSILKENSFINIEGIVARVVKVGSGRVVLDFNHPLAGKEIIYKFKIKRKIEDEEEKVAAILQFFNVKEYKIEKNGSIKIKTKAKLPEKVIELIKKYTNCVLEDKD
uniref:Peptidyl-prolyl cis-trans isomerase n=1 Tax=Thermodesulfobacterium geofontis TaxID=1295609 RepID=A0A7V4N3U0_9BACT